MTESAARELADRILDWKPTYPYSSEVGKNVKVYDQGWNDARDALSKALLSSRLVEMPRVGSPESILKQVEEIIARSRKKHPNMPDIPRGWNEVLNIISTMVLEKDISIVNFLKGVE